MDFWGATFYLTTREAGCSADSGCKVTDKVIDDSIAGMRSKTQNDDQNWSTMGHLVYAKTIGKRAFIGEFGIADRYANGEKPFHMGDEPYAIDVLTRFVLDFRDDIEATVWFNSLNIESGKRFYSCLDGASGCTMPNAARRVKELWGPSSPFR
jgi:hypothetical protein